MYKDEGENKKTICRDYLRNTCFRGEACKYDHPYKKYVFCHDYQNGKCKRRDCRFIHCSREDEEHYNQWGELPPHLAQLPQVSSADSTEVPFCKDFLKGDCTRIVCKFRHVSVQQDQCSDCAQNKRRRYESTPPDDYNGLGNCYEERMVWIGEHEYSLLRKTVAELKRRVDELQATNEFLLEQNAKMRLSNCDKTLHQAAITVPTVTITSAPPPPLAQAALPTVTASVATVPVSIAAVAATPVSLGGVSMAQGAVQIAPPSVSMAQQHEHETTVTQTLQSLVSYPLVARPVLQPH